MMARRSRARASLSAVGLVVLLATVLGCEILDSGANDGALGSDGTGGFAGTGGTLDGPMGGTGGAGGAGGADAMPGAGGAAGMGGVAGAMAPTIVELDPTFGVDGISIFSIIDGTWTSEGARALAVMPDDRIVIAGTLHDSAFGPTHGFAALLTEEGALDASFGADGSGIVQESFEESTEFSAVALDSVGRIVIGGWTRSWKPGDSGAFTLARYLVDGSADRSFGDDPALAGVTQLSAPCAIETTDIAVQPDGKIVATGTACEMTKRFAAVRTLFDGTPDAAFGDRGMLLMDPGYSEEVLISSDADGATRILVGGSMGDIGFNGSLDFAIAGISEDGALDATFGDRGVVITDFGDGSPGRSEGLTALALAPGGRTLAAGWVQLLPNFTEPWQYSYDFLVAAYDAEGSLDDAFGDGGSVLIDFGSDSEGAIEVLRRSNGNLVVVGESAPSIWQRRVGIAHLTSEGAPAEGEHKTLTELEGAGFNPQAAILDNQGRLVVAGYVVYGNGIVDVCVARYAFTEME